MWACAAASAVRARRLPARWYGEPEDATVAGAETREVSWAAHLGEEMDTPLPRLTRASVRWAPPGLGVEAAAPFGGVLVPASGVRLLAAAERTLEGAR